MQYCTKPDNPTQLSISETLHTLANYGIGSMHPFVNVFNRLEAVRQMFEQHEYTWIHQKQKQGVHHIEGTYTHTHTHTHT